jgi:hypothetical protein
MRFICLFIVLVVIGCSSSGNETEWLTKEIEPRENELKKQEAERVANQIKLEGHNNEQIAEVSETVQIEVGYLKYVKHENGEGKQIEVMTENLGVKNWVVAHQACVALGDGWRLPNIKELRALYENKTQIGGFVDGYYWSSSIFGAEIWVINFYNGTTFTNQKYGAFHLRLVRDLK